MKHIIMTLLAAVSFVACTVPTTQVATVATSTVTPTQTITSATDEETKVRDLVNSFGKRLQTVSLLSPDAVQQMQKQYSEFVSPSLLETWMKDVAKAPGRAVSSPWPDRIEIAVLSRDGPDHYVITGFVIEVTSVEMVNGGAAARIPVHIVVEKDQDRWLISEYAEGQ